MEIHTTSQKQTPRGLRNNNPLNIENSPTSTWLGQCGADKRFCIFENRMYGYRAAFRIMYTYRSKYEIYSVRQIIDRWAPSSENNTSAYIRQVCKLMGVEPTFILRFGSPWNDDKQWCCKLIHAMACVENGVEWNVIRESEISDAYDRAFHHFM